MPKISIIIPVYSTEQYLRKCLDSCINQTFKDIEIIVVNDCSPDNSDVIMHEYEKKYPDLIKCLYLDKNIKQGGARNRGIEIAKGEYLTFLDSDDWIADDMCEELYKSAISNNADIVICDRNYVTNDKIIHQSDFSANLKPMTDISKKVLFDNCIMIGCCYKLYKKNLIYKSKIKFPENTFYEDVAIGFEWYINADRINFVNKPLYYYFRHENSTVNNFSIINKKQHINSMYVLLNILTKNAVLYQDYKDAISRFILKEISNLILYNIVNMSDEIYILLKKLRSSAIKNIQNWKEILYEIEHLNEYEKCVLYNFLADEKYFENVYKKTKVYLHKENVVYCIGIWGAGVWGKRISEFLISCDIVPSYIIDSNKKFWGTYNEKNIPLIGFDDIKDKCDIIIVSIKDVDIYNRIKERIQAVKPDIEVKYFMELFCL